MHNLINLKGRLLDLSTPAVMGILNLTPDSFFDGGKYDSAEKAIERSGRMLEEGASIIDIGAQSTRPGAALLSMEEEWSRLEPIVKAFVRAFPSTPFSIDTFSSKVAERAVNEGAAMINDVSGGKMDPAMFAIAGKLQVPYILMHMQGTPSTMQQNPHYINVVREVFDELIVKTRELQEAGVKDIIIDPGFGFGKSVAHNFDLLRHLDIFRLIGFPVLAGLSRKSMINRILGTKPEEALNGTTVLHTLALNHGARLLRVHDVKEAVEAIKLFMFYKNHA